MASTLPSTAAQPLRRNAKKTNKFNAKRSPCDLGGKPHYHGSKWERTRHHQLLMKEAQGEIQDLKIHSKWPLYAYRRGEPISVGYYEDDFSYLIGDHLVVEDTKSPATKDDAYYKLKKRLFEACYEHTITEVEK